MARFANIELQDLTGEIHGLCKDQHGCRFLQKKLEERKPEAIQLVFDETEPHVVELMTDPFGNYLCQKLFEYATIEQRTGLLRAASPRMLDIALNQHGTRALQKLIEYLTTREQIGMLIDALRDDVVHLIQDLNGNHVVQKCLNHLKHEDSQFVIDAVAKHVVIVGTHRHGCCVLQRCVDHASDAQRTQLVKAITNDAFALVQDPFGNYVVQYTLDLNEPRYTDPLCMRFVGNVANLSRQKFSSNVMEKCIRVSDEVTKRLLIEELLDTNKLDRMMRDSFGNYVVQTAMDYAEPETKAQLVEAIRPIVPALRHTPHGRRLQSKLAEHDLEQGVGGMSIGGSSLPYVNNYGRGLVVNPMPGLPGMPGVNGMNGAYGMGHIDGVTTPNGRGYNHQQPMVRYGRPYVANGAPSMAHPMDPTNPNGYLNDSRPGGAVLNGTRNGAQRSENRSSAHSDGSRTSSQVKGGASA